MARFNEIPYWQRWPKEEIDRIREAMCTGKMKISRQEKSQAKRKHRAKGYTGQSLYRCPFCDYWHFGHKSKGEDGDATGQDAGCGTP